MGKTMVPANGVDLCVEAFGSRDDTALLLIAGGASAMDWWDDELCRGLAAGGRFVIRYDHRDTGRSTSYPAGRPPYSQADLAGDALGVLDAFGVARAHLAGLSLGGALAQRLAVEDPTRVLSLTLMSTSPGSLSPPAGVPAARVIHQASPPPEPPAQVHQASPPHGPAGTLPGHLASPALGPTSRLSDRRAAPRRESADLRGAPAAGRGPVRSVTDWSDRESAVDRIVADVLACGGPLTAAEPQVRALAGQVFDRTTDMAASQTNHWLAATGSQIRDRLGTISAPALILHGTLDPVFSLAHAEVLAREIPGARLVPLLDVGHEFPPAPIRPFVITELLRQTS